MVPVSRQALLGECTPVALATPKSMTFGVGPAVDSVTRTFGLQVAVDDPLLVGVLHRLADGDEQLQPGRDRQPVAVAILGDRHALDQLHHEERLAGSSVVPPSKTRAMFGWSISASACRSASNRASTASESIPILISLSATCRLTGSRLLGAVDRAHPPFAENLAQRVPAGDDPARDESTGRVGLRGTHERRESCRPICFRGRRFWRESLS